MKRFRSKMQNREKPNAHMTHKSDGGRAWEGKWGEYEMGETNECRARDYVVQNQHYRGEAK